MLVPSSTLDQLCTLEKFHQIRCFVEKECGLGHPKLGVSYNTYAPDGRTALCYQRWRQRWRFYDFMTVT